MKKKFGFRGKAFKRAILLKTLGRREGGTLMDLNIYIRNNQRKYVVDEKIKETFRNLVKEAVSHEKIMVPIEISITFVNNKSIKKINNEFRKINKPTDVLSFPMYEKDELKNVIALNINEVILLGDIIISLEKAYEQADEYGHSFEREVSYLFVHGLLHLLGYDHIKKDESVIMRTKEEEILELMNLPRRKV